MKRVAFALAALTALAVPQFAAGEARAQAGVFVAAQSPDEYLAKDSLIGAKVHGPDGTIIGDVEDLIINDYNQVVGVVMGTGGYFGLFEKKIGVALSALKFDDSSGATVVSLAEATPEGLAAAEAFKRTSPKKSLLQRAKEKAEEFRDKTSVSTKDAVEKAKPALEQAKEKAKEAYEKAKESAAPALEKAKEAVQEGYEKAKEAAKSATEAAKDAIDKAKEAAQPAPADAPAAPAEAPAAPAEAPAAPAEAPAAPAEAPAAPAEAPAAPEAAPAAPATP